MEKGPTSNQETTRYNANAQTETAKFQKVFTHNIMWAKTFLF